jgi:integrase
MPFTFKSGSQMGIKNQKGTVSAENYLNRVRFRWRYQGKRYSLNLGAYTKTNLSASKKNVLQIQLDISNGNFDESLVRYGAKKEKVSPSKTVSSPKNSTF